MELMTNYASAASLLREAYYAQHITRSILRAEYYFFLNLMLMAISIRKTAVNADSRAM
jgi:hypothetical protein